MYSTIVRSEYYDIQNDTSMGFVSSTLIPQYHSLGHSSMCDDMVVIVEVQRFVLS